MNIYDLEPRKPDVQGSGHFGASRGGRSHMGLDLAAEPGTPIHAPINGCVTKIGWPYADPNKRHIRYVQVTAGDYDFRVFYVDPCVAVGDTVTVDTVIGHGQSTGEFYPGITEHVHFEIKRGRDYIDPTPVFIAGASLRR